MYKQLQKTQKESLYQNKSKIFKGESRNNKKKKMNKTQYKRNEKDQRILPSISETKT